LPPTSSSSPAPQQSHAADRLPASPAPPLLESLPLRCN
jgi:hypothetical protein